MKRSKHSKTIIVVSAHSDDHVIGAGATMAKYARQGFKVLTIIISLGELSHPWLKQEHIAKQRVKEAVKANKILGCEKPIFFNIPEVKFKTLLDDQNIEKLVKIFNKYKPDMVFTHTPDDPHLGHKITLQAVLKALQSSSIGKEVKPMLLGFDVWTLFKFKQASNPRIYIDVSDTFAVKMKALKVFETQKISIINLFLSIYLKALIGGFKIKKRFAEVFYKL